MTAALMLDEVGFVDAEALLAQVWREAFSNVPPAGRCSPQAQRQPPAAAMPDPALLELLRLAVQLELQPLQALVMRLAPTPPPVHDELLQALAEAFPDPFSSAEVLEVAVMKLSTREPLRQALASLSIRTAHQLSTVLVQMVKTTAGQPLRVVRAAKEDNTRLWRVEGGPGA